MLFNLFNTVNIDTIYKLSCRSDMHTPDKPRPSEDSGYLPLRSRTVDQRAIKKVLVKVLKDSQTAAVALYTLSDSEDSESDLSMLVEDTPLNIIDLLAKHGQENLSVDHTYIHEVKELIHGASQQIVCGNIKGKVD